MSILKDNNGFSGNPIIRNKFSADPTVLVHDDTVYLYTGHDDPPDGVDDYVMRDWLCYSSRDLVNWEEHACPLQVSDFTWAKGDAFASHVISKDGKFFWYAAVTHASVPGKAIGVAVSSTPTGPFRDALGAALLDSSMLPGGGALMGNMDPSVLIDDDGTVHLFWGYQTCYHCLLSPGMTQIRGGISTVALPGFSEGILIYKKAGWYYLSYGSGMPEKVLYARSRSVNGPWESKGVLNQMPDNCETNRPAFLVYRGHSYFLYHNGALPGGGSHRRSVCIDRLDFDPEGSIRPVVMTQQGVVLPTR